MWIEQPGDLHFQCQCKQHEDIFQDRKGVYALFSTFYERTHITSIYTDSALFFLPQGSLFTGEL